MKKVISVVIALVAFVLLSGVSVAQGPEVYKQSPWWPYLSAHIDNESPPDVLGGPIELELTQASGGVNWVLPGPRALDPAIFGTEGAPKATEVPPVILGAPMQIRDVLEDGTFTTNVPTPFGNKFASTKGSMELRLVDATAIDGATTKDQVDFVAEFDAPDGSGTYRVEVKNAAPHGWFIPTGGGVVTNFIQHGVTKWGTQLMPTEYSYASFWGPGNIYFNDELIAEGRLVHGMFTEFVRKQPYDLVWDGEVNPNARHFHLMIPPFTPKGEQSPVPTGFELPNGQEQPFFHVMFPNIDAKRVEALRANVHASLASSETPADLPWTTAEEVYGPQAQQTATSAQDRPIYEMSPWWPYLSGHIEDESPPQILGGPIEINGTQESGGANWVFPGPRALDPTIFGTAESPKATEVPPIILGAPMQVRQENEDGTFTTNVPTPFGNNFGTSKGSLQMRLVDATATDGAATQDQVDFVATFDAPDGSGTYRVEVKNAAPHGWFIPTGGGVVTNFIQHGVTKWGTQLMPTEYSYASFWGPGNIYFNDELIAEGRLVHGMLTEFVRKQPYDLVWDGEVNPNARHFHLMIPPFTPKGEQSPVPTGFELPNGQEQPFFHVMFPSVDTSSMALTPSQETGEAPETLPETGGTSSVPVATWALVLAAAGVLLLGAGYGLKRRFD